MALKIDTTPLPGSKLEIRVEADAAEVDKSFDRVFSRLQQEAHVPGFRPGKAPRAILERRIGEEALRQMAWQEFLEKTYAPAIEELNIQPFGDPEMPDLEEWDGFQRGQDLELSLTWTVHPRPELPDYLHLKLVKPSAEVAEEDIEEQLKSLREAHAKQQPTDRETVEDGDAVTVHVTVLEGESDEIAEEQDVELVAEQASEDPLRSAIVGAIKGQEFETRLRSPHEEDGEEHEGPRVKIRVDEIAERVLPELDAEFAKTVDDSLDSVEALRVFVAERLSADRKRAAEAMVRNLAMTLVDATTRMDLPPELVNQAASGEMRRYAQDMLSDGMSADRVRELVSDRESGLADAILRNTVGDLRMMYIEEAIVREQEIEVEEADIERALAEYAEEHAIDVASLRQMVEMQEETEHQFADRARRMKIRDMLVENAEIEEVPWEAFPLRARRLVEEAVGGYPSVADEMEGEEPFPGDTALADTEEAEETAAGSAGDAAPAGEEES
jgi:trigger factor